MNKLEYNICAAMHNQGLVVEAEKLINNFLGEGEDIIYVINPDGTYLKLQPGAKLTSICSLGIIEEDK